MRKLLVTGAAGFIGSNFVRYWREHFPDDLIVIVDSLTYAGNYENLEGLIDDNCKFHELSITESASILEILRQYSLDYIVNFAAESHVDKSISGPDIFVQTNVVGTHSLLQAAKEAWMDDAQVDKKHHFHHVSTDEVYGSLGFEDPAFVETTAYAPNSPYAASKASSDFLVRAYHHTYNLNTTISNCSNNYGSYQFPEKLIPLVIVNLLENKALPVYGNGLNVRDWLHVDDHSAGIASILEKGVFGETYNIGGGSERSNLDIVNLICKTIDKKFSNSAELRQQYPKCPASDGNQCEANIEFVKDRAGHDLRYAINSEKLATELGCVPTKNFEKALDETIDWYLNNSSWWGRIIDGSYRKNNRELASQD